MQGLGFQLSPALAGPISHEYSALLRSKNSSCFVGNLARDLAGGHKLVDAIGNVSHQAASAFFTAPPVRLVLSCLRRLSRRRNPRRHIAQFTHQRLNQRGDCSTVG